MQQSGSDKIGGDDDEPDTKPPAEAAGSGKKQKGKVTLTRKGKVRKPKAKKPKDMPRRPLSAYNLFFREQRARIVEEREQSDAAVEESDLFSTMGKTIAKRWKMLTPEQMVKYQGLAEIEMKRYRQEMEEYHLAVAKRNRQNQMSAAQPGQEEDARLPPSIPSYAAAPARMMQEGVEEGKSNSLSSDLLMSQLPEYRQQQQQQYQQEAASALNMSGLSPGLLGSSQPYLPQLGADSSMQGLSGFGSLGFPANLSAQQYLQQLNSMTDNSLLQSRASLDDSLRSLQLPPNPNIGNPSSLDSHLLVALSRNNNDYSSAFRSQILDAQLANALQEQSRQASLGLGGSLDRLGAGDQPGGYAPGLARMPQQPQQAGLQGQGSVSSPLIQLLRHQQEEQRQMQQRNAPSSGGGQGAGYGYGSFFPGQGNK